ncbi:MAG: nucleoid-associated protein, YbaB/EbfC family, partial [Mycoplasma sp. CAG:611_25_7]
MNMQAILKQAQNMQKEITNAQKEINEMEFTGKNGLVTVIVKGTRNIKSIRIEEDEDIKEDLSILEDMLTIAINDAFKQIDDITN